MQRSTLRLHSHARRRTSMLCCGCAQASCSRLLERGCSCLTRLLRGLMWQGSHSQSQVTKNLQPARVCCSPSFRLAAARTFRIRLHQCENREVLSAISSLLQTFAQSCMSQSTQPRFTKPTNGYRRNSGASRKVELQHRKSKCALRQASCSTKARTAAKRATLTARVIVRAQHK